MASVTGIDKASDLSSLRQRAWRAEGAEEEFHHVTPRYPGPCRERQRHHRESTRIGAAPQAAEEGDMSHYGIQGVPAEDEGGERGEAVGAQPTVPGKYVATHFVVICGSTLLW